MFQQGLRQIPGITRGTTRILIHALFLSSQNQMSTGAQLQIPTQFCGKSALKIYLSTHSWQLLTDKVKVFQTFKKIDSQMHKTRKGLLLTDVEVKYRIGQVTSKGVECKGQGGSEKQWGSCKCYYGINNVTLLKQRLFCSTFQRGKTNQECGACL